ncbi:MAG: hypothetical protein AB8B81_22755 [Halioglobus sp.]
MALVKCPDCNTDVSDQAAVCPNCARPTPGLSETEVEAQVLEENEATAEGIAALFKLWIFHAFIVFLGKGIFVGGFAYGVKKGLLALLIGPFAWFF